jgi:Coenzyme PQQ synthesis protein D (PqqD)
LAGDVHAYRFNHDVFAFESFADEIVVLNLIDGIYYAFGGAAVVAWPYLVAQHSQSVIAPALATRYSVAPDRLGLDLSEFVERLLNEKILLTAAENTSEINYSQLDPLPEYQGFSFERHADMEDLLTLDPIHDVDSQKGWPRT